MIGFFPIGPVISGLVVFYAIVVLGVAAIFRPDMSTWTLFDVMRAATVGLAPYTLSVLGLAYFGWRFAWKYIPALNAIYPDLNGKWEITISSNYNNQNLTVTAAATIRQNLFRVSMEVDAPHSDSKTLSAVPKKDPESGRAALHYIYLVTPHATPDSAHRPYYGAAVLVLSTDLSRELAGNYWTSHKSTGRVSLCRRPE